MIQNCLEVFQNELKTKDKIIWSRSVESSR